MCEVQLDRLTETDRQMKQTQGPQRFAFCANQINTFNKAYRYQTAIQLYEKISQIHTIFQCTNATKNGFAIQAIKKHHRNTLFFKKQRQLYREASSKRGRDRRAKAQSDKQLPLAKTQTKTQALTRLRDTLLPDSTARGERL